MISFVENVVIFITSILTILIIWRLVISQQQTQRAIRWWYQRQHLKVNADMGTLRKMPSWINNSLLIPAASKSA